ncbi:hypothetical protein O181_050161 [Austropuccinia psidii MF-1]|uniref:Uncharacterized protein n=1 Tax=Austropuccinia psidii MF-1 TaxID=1389203 RepID=A0A9Q3HM37_9BASI|nr:hypothetical protein [Austropuccinia psidii MF-1]
MSGGSRVSPHSPRSVPTSFDVNSEPSLIEGSILRAEPFPSGIHKNILVPVQKLVQRIQGRGVGNMPKPLAGAMNSYLHIKSLLGQEKTIELLGGWSPFSFKEKVKKINNWFKKQILLSVDQKKELEMTPALEKEGPVASTSSINVQRQAQKDLRGSRKVPRTIRAREKANTIGTDPTHKGTGSPNWNLQQWTVFQIWPELLWNSQPKIRKGLTGLFHTRNR